jgi:hypothetical protein
MVFKKGYKQSESQKQKLSEIRKINFKGKGNPFFGKKHSDKTKDIIGLKSKGRDNGTSLPDGTEKINICNGYIYTKRGYSWILKHREVYEKFHNILLRPRQFIHHIDGNKTNNCIENLKLMTPKEHMAYHKNRLGTGLHPDKKMWSDIRGKINCLEESGEQEVHR